MGKTATICGKYSLTSEQYSPFPGTIKQVN
jgi:hypothetical protein